MNKTIIININGIVFHIEEDAYEILKAYMTDVKKHFAYSTDSEEIVSDIENRIAEMFTERLAEDKKQVIVLSDVEYVTAQMGRVSDFEILDETSFTETSRVERKLFRDPDDRILGGVCSGIGHYFDVEPKWIRLISILIFFMAGTGLFIYLALWIVIPVAKTRSEKMAMKGEAINLQNFKKNFDEEVETLKHNFTRVKLEAKPAINNIGNFIRDVIEHLGKFLGGFIRIVVKIIGIFIILVGGAIFFGLAVALLALLGFGNTTDLNYFPLNIINPEYQSALYFGAFVLIIIPLTALILFAFRVIFNRKTVSRTGAFAMLLIWLTGLGTVIYYGSRLGAEFTEEASFSEVQDINPSTVYYLKLNDAKLLSKRDSLKFGIGNESGDRIIINGRNSEIRMPDAISLTIERADIEKPSLTKIYTAHGKSFESALKTAQKIDYKIEAIDSIIRFNRNIISNDQLWRDQEVKLTFRVPLNTRLIIDTQLNHILENYNLWDCLPEGTHENTLSEWIMTEEGLKCQNDSLPNQNGKEFN